MTVAMNAAIFKKLHEAGTLLYFFFSLTIPILTGYNWAWILFSYAIIIQGNFLVIAFIYTSLSRIAFFLALDMNLSYERKIVV